ncbi:MAG: glutathione peroxidase [Plesiomonas sp.]|uniref:glutathione peroxidase n=1 Tax=Plesiomonas sp. TaxID=2486279 RepID=UPI003F3CE5D9
MTSLYDFELTELTGHPFDVQSLKGKVVLIVNVASRCGFTQQYEGLEALYRELSSLGLQILAFPCNQFGEQEPGAADEIIHFCTSNYNVTFPIMQKVEVNGGGSHPLFRWLKIQRPGVLGTTVIKWNFTKFLLDGKGNVVERYAPQTAPESLHADIIKYLDHQK